MYVSCKDSSSEYYVYHATDSCWSGPLRVLQRNDLPWIDVCAGGGRSVFGTIAGLAVGGVQHGVPVDLARQLEGKICAWCEVAGQAPLTSCNLSP